jgi:hypothetical protein
MLSVGNQANEHDHKNKHSHRHKSHHYFVTKPHCDRVRHVLDILHLLISLHQVVVLFVIYLINDHRVLSKSCGQALGDFFHALSHAKHLLFNF